VQVGNRNLSGWDKECVLAVAGVTGGGYGEEIVLEFRKLSGALEGGSGDNSGYWGVSGGRGRSEREKGR